ncbi:MAG: KDO2-lipid IV(A) lauroyltransferase [Candidatus Tokpelaia sp. JSC161]|jgi:KDO2-lipid IV(A) lauroyltransferase|nr:MAG: KDO2-lipid IV(A) lauroyltransferase [Candidatus Tokpelaia sp. JSC161]
MLLTYFKPFIQPTQRQIKSQWKWLWGHILTTILGGLKYLPAKKAITLFAKIAMTLGPLTHRHKIALENLYAAYPEKSKAEIKMIASEMWGNMGRLVAEYVFLDKIFDFDPHQKQNGLIEVSGIELFEKIKNDKKPIIFFTAHTGNFELLPICAAKLNVNITALFRPPNNPYIAKRVLQTRSMTMGLIPSQAGAALALTEKLKMGGNIGVLVDQKFTSGIPGTFFKRPVKTNPLLAKLARTFNCDVYPTRCIRLPEGRYRLEIYPPMKFARTQNGSIDVPLSTQQLNDLVETWVREYPSQWMWFHKRWTHS